MSPAPLPLPMSSGVCTWPWASFSGEANQRDGKSARASRPFALRFITGTFFSPQGGSATYMSCFNFFAIVREKSCTVLWNVVFLVDWYRSKISNGTYRLIEKIKCREESRYAAPYGCGKLKKMLLPEFFFLEIYSTMYKTNLDESKKFAFPSYQRERERELIPCAINACFILYKRNIIFSHTLRSEKVVPLKKKHSSEERNRYVFLLD